MSLSAVGRLATYCGEVSHGERQQNKHDACGDIAVAWPKLGGPIVISADTQGGTSAGVLFTRSTCQ